jgi:competence protein ComEC
VFGLFIYLSVFLLGIFLTDKDLEVPANSLNESSQPVEVVGTIREPPEEKAKSVQCYMNVEEAREGEKLVHCKDKVLIYFQKDSSAKTLKAGDVIIFKSIFNKIKSSGNPYEFDYKRYMAFQGIRLSGYVDARSWKYLFSGHLPVFKKWAYYLRSKLLAIFPDLGMKGDELGVASALIVGDKANLDNEIKRAYVASGTMHILAVSGMHVALLYWVLNACLFFLDRLKHGKYLKLIILLLAVWLYAMITGLSGSVLRAAAMITFVIVGNSFSRNVNIFNSLAASAFVLLLFNPFNLTDVGFQLSYVAVISIVTFYPLIYERIEIQNWFGNQLWSITAVTIAAQIVTTPLSLYYFHQFPNLFLVSNIIMIPLSTVIMYMAMTLIPFSGWGWMMGWLGKVFNSLVWLLNKVVLTIEGLPFALTKGIYISWLDVCLFYVLIGFMAFYFIKKQAVYFLLGLTTVLVLLTHGLFVKYQYFTSKEMMVYNDKDNVIIQFRSGAESTWLVAGKCDHLPRFVQTSADAMLCKTNHVFLLDSVKRVSQQTGRWLGEGLWIKGDFIQFFERRIAVMDGEQTAKSLSKQIRVDYLIVSNVNHNKETLPGHLNVKKFLVTAPVISGYMSRKMERLVANPKMVIYNIEKSGAFREKL